MRTMRIHRWIGGTGLALALLWTSPVFAQTFSSGSTGALGAFAPATNTVVTLPPDGVLNYTTVTIPAGVTVSFLKNAANTPVTMLATGDVLVNGAINVNGANGFNSTGSLSVTVQSGGAPGPGGFVGGQSGSRGLTNNSASAGYGSGGGAGSVAAVSNAVAPTYGAPTAFVALVPLFGGSGGGGGAGDAGSTGASGGGGGGAIVVASTTKITVGGSITANGGNGGAGGASITFSSGGSGGAIRLVAPQITASGTMSAAGGSSGFAGAAGNGRIRIEALTTGFINPTTPTASVVAALGPITAASTPALISFPSVIISSVGGVASPATSTGSYSTADVSLPSGTTNPVPVTVTVNNIPLGTVFTVKLIPQFAAATTVSSTASSGTFTVATATANVTFPNGQISTLNAFAGFTLTASLMPLIDGEPAEQVMVAAEYGQPSTVTLRTRSGKEMRADQLSQEDQVKLTRAWEDFSRTR